MENDLAERGDRRSIRLPEYDYAAPGSYFVTIETAELRCVLGKVIGSEVRLSHLGRLVEWCWREIPHHFARTTLDANVIMPNHLHGMIVMWPEEGATCRARTDPGGDPRDPGVAFSPVVHDAGTKNAFGPLVARSLGSIVRAFKAAVTTKARNRSLCNTSPLWKRNYYEHIIRRSESLEEIRRYIAENPARWAEEH